MNKLVVTLIVFAFLAAATITGVAFFANSNFKSNLTEIQSKKSSAQTELDKLKADKDTNGYLPSDVVKYFINELKNGSGDKAKLYLATATKETSTETLFGQKYDFTTVIVKDATYEIADGDATVATSLAFGEQEITKSFVLAKENDAWKIVEAGE